MYSNSIFYPMLSIVNGKTTNITRDNFPELLRSMIDKFIANHKISQIAHEEIITMTHSDKEVAEIFHKSEMEMTNKIAQILINNGLNSENLKEKVHTSISMIDNLCHEIVYHKHAELNCEKMIDIVISTISYMLL